MESEEGVEPAPQAKNASGTARFVVQMFALSLLLAGVLSSLGFGLPFGIFPGAVAFGNTPPFAFAGLVVGSLLGAGFGVWRVVKRRIFLALPAVAAGAAGGAIFAYFVGGFWVALPAFRIWLAFQP